MATQSQRKANFPLLPIAVLLLIPWVLWIVAGDCAWAMPGQSPLNQTVPPRKPTPPISPVEPPGEPSTEGGGGASVVSGVELTSTLILSSSPAEDAHVPPVEETASPRSPVGTIEALTVSGAVPQDTPDMEVAAVQAEEPAVFETPLRPLDRQESSTVAASAREREDRPERGISATQLGMCMIPISGVFLLLLGAVLWIRAGAR